MWNRWISAATVALAILCHIANAEFPNDPKPCKYGDSECIIKIINSLMKEKYQGDETFDLVSIDPMRVDEARIKQGADSPVNVDLLLTNNNIYGWKTAKVLKLKGFGKDLTKKHELLFHADYLSLIGDYNINGKVLILPIRGNGKSNITMLDVKLRISFTGKPLEKDGATYLEINNFELDAEPNGLEFTVENLFNGDKALSDNMNLFLNENWKEIYVEVHESLAKAFAGIYRDVIAKVFAKIPYDKLFVE